MKILELFCGTKSISKAFEKEGHQTFTVDYNAAHHPDLCLDVMHLRTDMIPFRPDVIWASPPCTTFSVASIGKHWKFGNPSPEAQMAIKLLSKTMEIIMLLRPKYWFIENPRGMMRKLPIFDMLNKNTVTYCQYGDNRMKPTDIWTNCLIWDAKMACKNGDDCHVSAPRGSRTGTQGLKNDIERGRIPSELCEELTKYLK